VALGFVGYKTAGLETERAELAGLIDWAALCGIIGGRCYCRMRPYIPVQVHSRSVTKAVSRVQIFREQKSDEELTCPALLDARSP
jgi:hypothetical protein